MCNHVIKIKYYKICKINPLAVTFKNYDPATKTNPLTVTFTNYNP